MIDTVVAIWLCIGFVVAVVAAMLLVWGLVLVSIILEDIVRCLWFGGNGEEGSDWRQRRRDYRRLVEKLKKTK